MGYTALDVRDVCVGFLLFSLFAFAPGYTFGWLSNVFDFRRRRLATRIAAAVPLSIGLTPTLAYFLWRCWLPLVWIVFGLSGALCLALLARDLKANRLHFSRAGRWVLVIAMAWLVVGTFSLVDVQIGNRLYFPFSAYDNSTRAAFTAALSRDGIPPHNPFFFAGQPAPLRYHYFWFIPCSLVSQLGGSLVSARIAIIASTLWCGLGLLALVALFLRFFQAKGGEDIERRTLIGVSLLGITGLDILPVLLIDANAHIVLPTVEWWNLQVAAWITTVLWVPHDLAGLVAGLTGFLLTWQATREGRRGPMIAATLGAAIAFATSVGASVYVGGTVAAGCALWLAITLAKRWWRNAIILGLAGGLAGALLAPFIREATHGLVGGEAHPHTWPISFMVRPFILVDHVAQMLRFSSRGDILALNAAVLPLNYFLEFGFFFIVGWVAVRQFRRHGFRNRAELCAAALGAASLFICTFMKSSVIRNNDLAARSPLVVQFLLILWAAEMWNDGVLGFGRGRVETAAQTRVAPRLVAATIVLGVMGSCYELCLQRTFPIISDWFPVQRYSWLSMDQQLGRRTYDVRRAYDELNRMLPQTETVQANPEGGIGNVPAELYSGRPMVADVGNCGTAFGGSSKFCREVILPKLKPIFDDPEPLRPADVAAVCREFSIAALFFKDTDPVWKDKKSWIWKAQPLVSNSYVRVIACGGATGKQSPGPTGSKAGPNRPPG